MYEKRTRSEKDSRSAVNPYARRGETQLVFFDGQVADDERIINGDVGEQTLAALERLQAVAADRGVDPADLMRTTVYLTRMEQVAAVDDAFEAFFDEERPSRTVVGVDALPNGAAVQIEATGVE